MHAYMKKTIFTALLCLIGVGAAKAVSPTETAYVGIKMTVVNSSSNARLRISEDSQRLNEFEDGYDASLMTLTPTNSTNIFLFAIEPNDTYCTSVYYKNVNGLRLGFKTNLLETQYTFTFTSASGRPLKLYDALLDSIVDIVVNDTYSFTAEAGQKVVLDRFIINPIFSVTTNTSGYATYSNSLDLVLEDAQAGDPKVYSAEYSTSGDEGVLTLHEEAGVNANCGVIIKGEPSTTYTLIPGTVADYLNTNSLSASVEETTLDASHQNFCMATINGLCAFYEYTGAKVSANKAYLTFGGTDAPKRIRMVVAGATALEDASAEAEAQKVLVDGQVLIIRDGVRYNLQGQIVK